MWPKIDAVIGMDRSEGDAFMTQTKRQQPSPPTLTLIRLNGTSDENRSGLKNSAAPLRPSFYGSLGRFVYTVLAGSTKR